MVQDIQGQRVSRMTAIELLRAIVALGCLAEESDGSNFFAVYVSPANQLRRQADEIEAKEKKTLECRRLKEKAGTLIGEEKKK